MVLTDLGGKIKEALNKLNKAENVDKNLFNEVLKDIGKALLLADIKVQIVGELQKKIKLQFAIIDEKSGNKKKHIQAAVVTELSNMLKCDKQAYQMKRGKANVIMFVGLQGSGKTTTCTKYAYHYQKKGWKVGLVCADTFRAAAFDQLKQNASKCKIPFYGSYTEVDPVKITEEGVSYFKKQKFDIIIIDTSGRHKQEDALFDEMKQVAEVAKPDEVIFIMDSHIGQACYDQAAAFNKAVSVGSVIITKLDGNAKGGGALSAVAATGSPITFIGTGEHFEEFQPFDPEGFISVLLGMGNIKGLFQKVKEVISEDKQKQLKETIQKGKFTIRDMRDQYQSILQMGPLDKVVEMIPGFSENMLPKGKEKEASAKIKKFLCMMDSMTDEELDGKKKLDDSRMKRICRGSGGSMFELKLFIEEFKKFEKMISKMPKLTKNNNELAAMQRNPGQFANKLNSMIPPEMLAKMGGVENMMNMMKDMGQMDGSFKPNTKRKN